jgi:CBS domain-containing protein
MGMHIIMITVVYTTMAIGIQFLSTPLNTWGMNSLRQQHGAARQPDRFGHDEPGGHLARHGDHRQPDRSRRHVRTRRAPTRYDRADVTGVHVAFMRHGHGPAPSSPSASWCSCAIRPKSRIRTMAAYPTVAQSKDIVPSGTAGVDRPFLVADVMNPKANTVPMTATVREAIDAMRATETSGVPVVDEATARRGVSCPTATC